MKVDAAGRSAPQLERLTEGIEEIGVQGVRPLTEEEVALYQDADVAGAAMGKLHQEPSGAGIDFPTAKRFYRQWCRDNAVVAATIGAEHQEFFNWLEWKPE